MSHEQKNNNLLLSIKFWLFNRDSYNGIFRKPYTGEYITPLLSQKEQPGALFSGGSNHLPLTTSSVADSPPDLAIGDHLHHSFHSAHSFSFWTLRGVENSCYQSIYQKILTNARMYKTQHKSLDKKLPPPINWWCAHIIHQIYQSGLTSIG